MGRELSKKQKDELRKVLEMYKDRFTDLPGKIERAQCQLKLTDTKPVVIPKRRIPLAMEEEVCREIREIEENGIIQESSSAFCSPLFIFS